MDLIPKYPGDDGYAAYLKLMPPLWVLRTWLQDLADIRERKRQGFN